MPDLELPPEMQPADPQRRRALGGISLGGAGAAVLAATGALTAAKAQTIPPAAPMDVAILQFALNFEYLGAELYLHALTGTGLSSSDITGVGTPGTVTAGGPVVFESAAIQSYVSRLAVDELAHVRFIRALLGADAIAEPSINLSTSWTTLAIAAGLIVPGQTFSPFNDEISLLLGAYVIEDVCVTALAGAARLLTDPDLVEGAAGLLGTEAYQAGMIRSLLSDLGAGAATNAISALRATLSGAADDVGTSIPGNAYNFLPTDSNSLVFRRTTSQVLNIAYGGGAGANYGFFPNLVNGSITM
jgi:hypothetical protein